MLVYNCASGSIRPITWNQVLNYGLAELRRSPLSGIFWYPGGTFTKSPLLNNLWLALCHFLPAYAVDAVMMLMGKKPL